MQRIPFPNPPNSCLSCPDSGLVPGAIAPHSMPADPRAQESTWPETTRFSFLTSIKAIIWEKRAALFCTNRIGLSYILGGAGGRGGRQLNETPRGRKKLHRVAHLSVSKYSIIFLSHTASCFCYGAVLHQHRCERERWCSWRASVGPDICLAFWEVMFWCCL